MDASPFFLKEKNIRDMDRRKPVDPKYDPTTLYIPATEKFTPAIDCYWEIKKLNMDKIFLFKLGKVL